MKLLLQEVSKSFPGKEVLEGINYTFEENCLYALLGRNGSGKTTLFNVISGQIRRDGGEILLEEDGERRPLTSSDVFMMVAEPELPEFLTGYEFLKFFIEANSDRVQEPASIEDYLAQVSLDRADALRLIQDYSTGMKNKLQMLMFLILRPKIILMDEPLTSLDVVVQLEMKKIIRSIKEDHIMIFSTHILQLAQDLCDRIILLHGKTLHDVDEKMAREEGFEDKIIALLQEEESQEDGHDGE